MSAYPAYDQEGPPLPVDPETKILAFNSEDSHAELFERARHAADVMHRAREESDRSRAVAKNARHARRAAQLEHHDRSVRLPLITLVALALLGLDSWAAYFAAEAVGGDQRVTMLWAVLFLVILGLLEAGLAGSAGRGKNIFYVIAAGISMLGSLVALLRFGFLAAAGTGLVAAVVVACLFTVCTMTFAAGGFVATRHAETITIWPARLRAPRTAGTRSDLIRSWANVAAPGQLAPVGPLLDRQGSMPRGQAKEICYASAIA